MVDAGDGEVADAVALVFRWNSSAGLTERGRDGERRGSVRASTDATVAGLVRPASTPRRGPLRRVLRRDPLLLHRARRRAAGRCGGGGRGGGATLLAVEWAVVTRRLPVRRRLRHGIGWTALALLFTATGVSHSRRGEVDSTVEAACLAVWLAAVIPVVLAAVIAVAPVDPPTLRRRLGMRAPGLDDGPGRAGRDRG